MDYLSGYVSNVPGLRTIMGWVGLSNDNADQTSITSVASSSSSSSSSSTSISHADPYEPCPMDVVVVKMMLQRGLNLPAEVVLSILDFAEYWPHTTAKFERNRPFVVQAGGTRENAFLLRTKPLGFIKQTHNDMHHYTHTASDPLPLTENAEYPLEQFQKWIGGPTGIVQRPCRKIVFTIKSHDQGWSNNARLDRGTYRGSYTWFEAGLERFDKTATPPKENNRKEAAGSSEPKLPNPYLPVSSLRSIYPTVNAERDPPEFHHDLLASPEHTIQHNKTATRESTVHKVVWSCHDDLDPLTEGQLSELGRGIQTGRGDFVRNLKPGDVVTVWGKTRFGGWANHIDDIQVDVYWAL